MRNRVSLAWLCICAALVLIGEHGTALAQAHNPFSVGISEGGGSATGISGWLLAKQSVFEQMLSGAVRAAKADGSAMWMLSGLSFAYGAFHAAGPGHGKAVVASYMFANERALKRGVIISFLAAALQGMVAILLIGILAIVFHAAAQRIKDAARIVESLSYAGIAVLGCWLVWRKGGAFLRVWRAQPAKTAPPRASAALPSAGDHAHDHHCCAGHDHEQHATLAVHNLLYGADGHMHGEDCGHLHTPDPATLGDRFSWSNAWMTVVAAGLRPCSGAILVLVFALAQGIFAAGVVATMAMSLGTAITTSGLASLAVLAGGLAVRIAGYGSRRGELFLRGIEACAGLVVLLLGAGLFLGVTTTGA